MGSREGETEEGGREGQTVPLELVLVAGVGRGPVRK